MKLNFNGKICIPIRPLHQGGGFYFVQLFCEFLSRQGIPWTEDVHDKFDILFADAWQVPYQVIYQVKGTCPHVRVIHRVDGSGRDRGRSDDGDHRQACVNLLADATVFQSRYSKFSTRQKFKVIKQDGPIIYNAVDITTFRPEGARIALPGRIHVCSASWSTGRWKGTWQIPRLARQNPDVTFVLCGRYPEVPDLPNVFYLGHLSYFDLARTMRSCSVFLNLSRNDPCPNVVLQALASGLPVLYKPSGGVPELVGDAGVPLKLDASNFREALAEAMDCRDTLAEKARRRAEECFAPNVVFSQYLHVMEQTQRHPLPTKRDFLRAALQGYPVLSYPLWKLPFRYALKTVTRIVQ